MTSKTEIVCIARSGFNFLHSEFIDLAAKVTQLTYTPGQTYDPRATNQSINGGVQQEMFVPRYGNWSQFMDGHYKECALAAIALRIERAIKEKDREEAKEWRKLYREISETPCEEPRQF